MSIVMHAMISTNNRLNKVSINTYPTCRFRRDSYAKRVLVICLSACHTLRLNRNGVS